MFTSPRWAPQKLRKFGALTSETLSESIWCLSRTSRPFSVNLNLKARITNNFELMYIPVRSLSQNLPPVLPTNSNAYPNFSTEFNYRTPSATLFPVSPTRPSETTFCTIELADRSLANGASVQNIELFVEPSSGGTREPECQLSLSIQ